jgi:hypothetical protein
MTFGSPYTVFILPPNSEARNTEIIRDIIDDQRAEAGIDSSRDSQCEVHEYCRVVHGRLDNWGPDKVT